MSHDSHDSHASHHDASDEIKKAVVLAILIIAGLFTAVAIFIARATPVHAAGGGHAAALPSAEQAHAHARRIPTRSRPELVRGALNRKAANPRMEYARYLNRRLRAKGRTCVVRARGDQFEDMVISWRKSDLDQEHMEQLKKAQGFVDILRDKGFANLLLKVDDKVVWRRALR